MLIAGHNASARASLLLALLVLATSCASDGGGPALRAAAAADDAAAVTESCPVTVPPQAGFVPPQGYPQIPSTPNAVWFGTRELWTVLETDGSQGPRKSVWWSVEFPGGIKEPEPEIDVLYRKLEAEGKSVHEGLPGTNAFTPEDGWFMIAGIDPPSRGCWQVTATYRDATLSYVYRIP